MIVNPNWQDDLNIIASCLHIPSDIQEDLIYELQHNEPEEVASAIELFIKRYQNKPVSYFRNLDDYYVDTNRSDEKCYFDFLLDLIVEQWIERKDIKLFDFDCPEGKWHGKLIYKIWGNNRNIKLYFQDYTNKDYYWFSVFSNNNYSPRKSNLNFKLEAENSEYLLETTKTKKRNNPQFISAIPWKKNIKLMSA